MKGLILHCIEGNGKQFTLAWGRAHTGAFLHLPGRGYSHMI